MRFYSYNNISACYYSYKDYGGPHKGKIRQELKKDEQKKRPKTILRKKTQNQTLTPTGDVVK